METFCTTGTRADTCSGVLLDRPLAECKQPVTALQLWLPEQLAFHLCHALSYKIQITPRFPQQPEGLMWCFPAVPVPLPPASCASLPSSGPNSCPHLPPTPHLSPASSLPARSSEILSGLVIVKWKERNRSPDICGCNLPGQDM